MVHIESNFLFLWNWHTSNPQIHMWQSAVIWETFAKTSQRVRGIKEKNLRIWSMVMSDAIFLQTQLKQTVRTLPLCNYDWRVQNCWSSLRLRLASWESLGIFLFVWVRTYLSLCVSTYVCMFGKIDKSLWGRLCTLYTDPQTFPRHGTIRLVDTARTICGWLCSISSVDKLTSFVSCCHCSCMGLSWLDKTFSFHYFLC